MAMNNPYGGGGSSVESTMSGQISPPNPLEDKDAAIARAMRMAGINPGSFSPLATSIRKKAGALVNELVLSAAQTGNIDALAAPAQALTMLADIIKRGATGGLIFGGKGGALSALADAASKTESGAGGIGEKLIAQLLQSPANAEALFLQGKYGGLSSQAQGAMATSLTGIMNDYQAQLEQNPQGAGSNVSSLLNLLLGRPTQSGLLPEVGPGGASGPGTGLGGGAGGALPSTATPSTPSSLPNPAAGMLPNPAGAMGGYGQQMMSGALGGLAALGAGGQSGNMPPGTQYGPPSPFAGQQITSPNNSFQPGNPANYLPEPIATLYRIQQGLAR